KRTKTDPRGPLRNGDLPNHLRAACQPWHGYGAAQAHHREAGTRSEGAGTETEEEGAAEGGLHRLGRGGRRPASGSGSEGRRQTSLPPRRDGHTLRAGPQRRQGGGEVRV